MTSHLTTGESALWALILNAFDDSYAADSYLRLSRAQMLEAIWNAAAGETVANRLTQSERTMLAGIVNEQAGSTIVSPLTHSWGQMLAAWFNAVSDDPDMSHLTSSSAQILAALVDVPVGGNDPLIRLSSTSVAYDALVGDLVGTLSVSNPSGSYTFSITADPDTKFVLDGGDDTLLELEATVDYDVATSHSVTIEADNGVDTPLTRTFTITVAAVVPDAFELADWDLDTGDTEADVTINSLPADGGTNITDIEYRIDGGSWVSAGGTTSFTITGLTNDVEYDVELRAVNAIGASAASDLKSVTPSAVVLRAAPENITFTTGASDSTPGVELDLPGGYGDARDAIAGDFVVGEYQVNGSGAWVEWLRVELTSQNITDLVDLDFTGNVTPMDDGTHNTRFLIEEADTTRGEVATGPQITITTTPANARISATGDYRISATGDYRVHG